MASNGDTPGVIAPPPLLFFGALAAAAAVDFGLVRVPTGLPRALRLGAGAVFAAAAVGLAAAALWRFRRAGTAAEPWRPSTTLVKDGVYRFTRNPMYMAMALLYLGLALAVDSGVALLLLLPLLALVQAGVISREERYLEGKFGDEYRRYRATVRRWI
ncbi:methyltransferase family protein [Craurococcus roseus]